MKNISTTSGVNNSASSNTLNVPFQIQHIAACSLVVFKAVSIVAGNSLLIILFGLKKKLRKKSLFLIVNMAIADVLLGAVTLPLKIYLRISRTSNIFAFVSYYLFSLASLISAVFVSCERFYAICRPLKHRTLSSTTYRTAIVVVWVLAVLSSTALTLLAKLISLKTAQTAACSFPVISLFVVCACNINIFRKANVGIPHINSTTGSRKNSAWQKLCRLSPPLLFWPGFLWSFLDWLPSWKALYKGNFCFMTSY